VRVQIPGSGKARKDISLNGTLTRRARTHGGLSLIERG
jgi:hypothetical protein